MTKKKSREDLVAIAKDLATLCRENGWAQLTEWALELTVPDRARWLLITAEPGLLGASMRERIRKAAGGRLDEISLQELAANPIQTVSAGRVVVHLECGRLLSAEEMVPLSELILTRPPGSFALLFENRGALADSRDLRILEQTVRKWAVTERSGGDLASHGIYLNGELGKKGFLQDRLTSDRARLEVWLDSSPVKNGSLARWQLLVLLDYVDMRLQDGSVATQHAAERIGDDDETRTARELARGRDLLAPRIDADLKALEERLVHALDRVPGQVERDLRGTLKREIPMISTTANLQELGRVIDQRITSATAAWRTNSRKEIETAERSLLSDLKALFSLVEWDVVDRCIRRGSAKGIDRLFDGIEGRLVNQLAQELATDITYSWLWRPDPANQRRVLLASATVAAVSTGLMLVLRVPLPWLPLVAGSTAAAAGWMGQSGVRDEVARDMAREVGEALQRDLGVVQRHVRQSVRSCRASLLDPLELRLEEIEKRLCASVDSGPEDDSRTEQKAERARASIESLRRRAETTE